MLFDSKKILDSYIGIAVKQLDELPDNTKLEIHNNKIIDFKMFFSCGTPVLHFTCNNNKYKFIYLEVDKKYLRTQQDHIPSLKITEYYLSQMFYLYIKNITNGSN